MDVGTHCIHLAGGRPGKNRLRSRRVCYTPQSSNRPMAFSDTVLNSYASNYLPMITLILGQMWLLRAGEAPHRQGMAFHTAAKGVTHAWTTLACHRYRLSQAGQLSVFSFDRVL